MKLTIGMIVKNEEKYLDRCLSSIKPILDNVDSELIITDTGSADRTVEIAKKYTDKVLHFDWINDFSVARNFGLEKAQGEWFMFLDADEIFQSCNGIITFFNSGEYKKYNSATYTVRNLDNDGGYSDFEARRMTKIFPETRFNGVIHEHLNTFKAPIKYISDIADHYGYVYNDDAERSRKFERNYQLLLKKYEQVKDKNPMIYAEMYDTLATGFKQREADEYLEKGIEWCIKNEHPLLVLMYCKKSRHLLFEKRNDDAIEVCDAYFGMSNSIRNEILISDAEIMVIKATAMYRKECWLEAADILADFFPVYDDIKTGKLNTKDKMYGSLSLASDKNYLSYVGQFLVCCLNSGKFDLALKTMADLPVSKYSDDRDTLESIIQLEVALLQNVGVQNLDVLCKQLDEYGRQKLKEAAGKLMPKTNSGKVVLTIGMIVKNEEKYLDRCLSAIKPILDNVNSELIITDTGSTDRTVEIAKKYTDKVLHFDWINDFAAARNFGLEKAQGEWFMFLDADDIFRSCENIIRFFNSGEYKSYNSAAYISNNPASDNVSTYTYNAQRITKLLPQTRFAGIVHEMLSTYGKPIKYLNDIADHYGYYYETEEDRVKKFERNSKLLLKRLSEESPVDPMLYIQLYETYMIVNKRAEADRYLDEGIAYARKCSITALAVMYSRKAYTAVTEERYSDAIEICKKYSDECGKRSADKEMLAIQSTAEFRLNRYEDALNSLKKLFYAYNEFEAGKTDTDDKDVVNYLASSEQNYLPFVCVFFVCCITLKKFSDALSMLPELKIKEHILSRDDSDSLVPLELQLLENLGYEYLDKFSVTLDEYGRQKLAQEAEKLKLRKNRGNVVLTIGMIVKNEEKYLDRCLSAIKPILDNVNSELIITDTGSTDKTVEISKKYTDKILHFDWCDDFSAARNTSFEIAKGEWFMFVDADDVFTDCGDLISFFNSAQHNDYGSASFTYRNIRSEDKNNYIDQYVIRIVKRSSQTRFIGRIHEVLDPMLEPVKKLDLIVEHYGYLYGENNIAADKRDRNERILLKELEETTAGSGKRVLLYYYLYEEVRDSEPEKAESYLDKGKETALSAKVNTIIPVIHEKLRLMLSRNENEAVIELCDEYFGFDKEIRPGEICADTEVYAAKSLALLSLERYEEALVNFKDFFRLYDLVNSGKLVTGDRYIYLPALSGDSNFSNMLLQFINCCIKADEKDALEGFLQIYPFTQYLNKDRKISLFHCIGILMQNNLDISPFLFGENEITIISAGLCCDLIAGFYDTAVDYNPINIKSQAKLPEAALFYEACINKALKNSIDINALIRRFIEIGSLCASETDNPSIKLANIISKADGYRKNRNYRDCISVLKDALAKYPNSATLIKGYIDIVSGDLSASHKSPVSSEMEKLAATVKANIRQLIKAGNTEAANKLIDDYTKINPTDPEIDEMKQLL